MNPATARQIVELMVNSISLGKEGRYDEALACLDEALEIDPDFFPVFERKGIILDKLARYEEAADSFDRFLKFMNHPDVYRLRDNSLLSGLADCERILAQNAADTEALLKHGDLLHRLHRFDDAVYSYDRVLETDAANPDTLNRRGNALLELNRHDEALESYNRAMETKPNNAVLLFNRGNVLQQLGRLEEAVEDYSRALSCKPDLAEAVMEQSHCHLIMGRYETGWRLYESRWQTEQLKNARLNSPKPLWLGNEQLGGKTILLWAEQGFGDTIQFLRYVPLVAQIAGQVTVRVQEALKSLTGTLKCRMSIAGHKDPLPFHDFHCPLMSLPLALSATLKSIPADIPYLATDFDRTKKWQVLLGPRHKPRIGVAWAGRQYGPSNRTRDMSLEALRPFLELNVEIISLQRQIPEKDRKTLESMPLIRRMGEELQDFADTAALIENLDMVISIDTAVAHLAGALGKTVWIMLRHSSEWRWLQERPDSPWYPTARLFRQKVRGDWAGVVHEIVKELEPT